MNSYQKQITLRQPDDWHLHLRDGKILNSVVGPSARIFRRAVVMPNLQPPITTIEAASDYRQRILNAIPQGISFTPLMTIYLTDDISSKILRDGFLKKIFFAAKLYPANATTNSSFGVTDLTKIYSVLETMEEIDMPLLIHGEVTDPDVDIFDRESVFIERHLDPLLGRFPSLRVVLEHITTENAAKYVQQSRAKLGATITPHHLQINRNAMFMGGLRSDFYCLPIAKREHHRIALRRAATGGHDCFFLGTDSAPHLRGDKESSCGCAGIFNSVTAIESYAQVFEEEGALERLEDFTSVNGPAFYKLPLNENKITLVKKPHVVPSRFEISSFDGKDDYLVPFHAGESLIWSYQE